MPFFSVIIPTYNRYEKLKVAVNSVLKQTFRDFDLTIIDDGSLDNTTTIESEYSGKFQYIRQKNSGVSSARNHGISITDSEYIAFLDSDDEWLPNKLIEHKNFIQRNKNHSLHQTEEIWIRRGKRVNPKLKHKKKDGSIFITSLDLCIISPSAVCLKRSLFDKFGKFDERMPACEDYDLWLRLTSRMKTGLINEPLVIKHGGHPDQLSMNFWGMDRFRVYSILKLLKNSSEDLPSEYIMAARSSAIEKCRILKQGADKRKNPQLSNYLDDIVSLISDGSCSSIDFQILLKKADHLLLSSPERLHF